MTLWLSVWAMGFLAWLVVLYVLDRPARPTYAKIYAYRLVCGLLSLGMILTTGKMLALWVELRQVIAACNR